jgi:hypothetical protein
LIRNLSVLTKKVWERLTGIEPRRLWLELTNTQNELTNTQNELTNSLHGRENRLHPFLREALNLLSDSTLLKNEFSPSGDEEESVFTKYGSDKDTRHSYGNVYLQALKENEKPRILEIGVGSVNNFPYAGLPAGGAIRAFREKYPNSMIVGVDIDPNSIEIIKKDGFQEFVVDQTSDASLDAAKEVLSTFGPFDLIIDDGFHDPHANIRTLQKLFNLLSDTGTYVIEDVHESLIDFWGSIVKNLPGKFEIFDMRALRPGVEDNILILIKKSGL